MTKEEAVKALGIKGTFYYALPQEWVETVQAEIGVDPVPHFVWLYDEEAPLFGRPCPITAAGAMIQEALGKARKAKSDIMREVRNMEKKIEDTVFDVSIPVNSRPMLNRMLELLEEHDTNSLLTERAKNDPRVRRLMWLLASQVYGQCTIIDMMEEWNKMYQEWLEAVEKQQVG